MKFSIALLSLVFSSLSAHAKPNCYATLEIPDLDEVMQVTVQLEDVNGTASMTMTKVGATAEDGHIFVFPQVKTSETATATLHEGEIDFAEYGKAKAIFTRPKSLPGVGEFRTLKSFMQDADEVLPLECK